MMVTRKVAATDVPPSSVGIVAFTVFVFALYEPVKLSTGTVIVPSSASGTPPTIPVSRHVWPSASAPIAPLS